MKNEIESLKAELSALRLEYLSLQAQAFDAWKEASESQAKLLKLQKAVAHNHEWHKNYDEFDGYSESELYEINCKALSLPNDFSHLEAFVRLSGETMRKLCIKEMCEVLPWEHRIEKLQAISEINLNDLKNNC